MLLGQCFEFQGRQLRRSFKPRKAKQRKLENVIEEDDDLLE